MKSDARFSPTMWNSYVQVCDEDDTENTTNGLESLNRVFKDVCPRGKINFRKCCETLHKFKIEQMGRFQHAMFDDQFNRQGKKTRERKLAVLEIMKLFTDEADIRDPEILVNFCCKFSSYDISFEYYEKRNMTEMTDSSIDVCESLLPPGYLQPDF